MLRRDGRPTRSAHLASLISPPRTSWWEWVIKREGNLPVYYGGSWQKCILCPPPSCFRSLFHMEMILHFCILVRDWLKNNWEQSIWWISRARPRCPLHCNSASFVNDKWISTIWAAQPKIHSSKRTFKSRLQFAIDKNVKIYKYLILSINKIGKHYIVLIRLGNYIHAK